MRVIGTEAAVRVIQRAHAERDGNLTITIGTGCCESTAPFLFEDFWPGPDQETVGEVGGVAVYAPGHLRQNYQDDQVMTIDVVEGVEAESMSIETEFSCRLILRAQGEDLGIDVGVGVACPASGPDIQTGWAFDGSVSHDSSTEKATGRGSEDAVEKATTVVTGGPSRVVGELPEALRHLRIRG